MTGHTCVMQPFLPCPSLRDHLRNICRAKAVPEVLRILQNVNGAGIPADIYRCLLQLCIDKRDLASGHMIQLLIQSNGLESDCLLGTYLIRLFDACDTFSAAYNAFTKLHHLNVFSWSAMISACARHGNSKQAIELFYSMRETDSKPDGHVFVAVLKACGDLTATMQGMSVHRQIIEDGFNSNTFVGNALIDMYAKCGKVEEARSVFDKQSQQDIVSWNAMITGYLQVAENENAFDLSLQLRRGRKKVDAVTYVSILKACSNMADFKEGKLTHLEIIENGFESNEFVGSTLVDMYAKFGHLADACNVFGTTSKCDLVTWNAMIAGYAQERCGHEAFQVFQKMLFQHGMMPNMVTIISILHACSSIASLMHGQMVHIFVIESGCSLNLSIFNALISMYADCGMLDLAFKVFHEMQRKDLVSWNTMIAGCSQNGLVQEALDLFENMKQEGEKPDVITWNTLLAGCARHGYTQEAFRVFHTMELDGCKPDSLSFVSILKACGSSGSLKQGILGHVQAIESGFGSDLVVINTCIDMYAKCGRVDLAQNVFDKAARKTVVTWNSMIAGYARYGCHLEAHRLFQRMVQQGIKVDIITWNTMIAGLVQYGHVEEAFKLFNEMSGMSMDPDDATFVNLVKGCSMTGALDLGKITHTLAIASGFELVTSVANSLINMYANCGSIQDSCNVFQMLPHRNVVTWNSIIASHALHSNFSLSVFHFERMVSEGFTPDGATLAGLLSACSHAGLLDKGCQWFNAMIKKHGIIPSNEHYNAVVDLLGRVGHLNEAEKLLKSIPFFSDRVGWMALLSNCKSYGNLELGKHCFESVSCFDDSHGSGYVLMSNIFTNADFLADADKVEALRKGSIAWKKAGTAYMEVHCKLHTFLAQTSSSPLAVHEKLSKLNVHLKALGWVPALVPVMDAKVHCP